MMLFVGNKTAISLLLVIDWADYWFSLVKEELYTLLHYDFYKPQSDIWHILAMNEYSCNES